MKNLLLLFGRHKFAGMSIPFHASSMKDLLLFDSHKSAVMSISDKQFKTSEFFFTVKGPLM
jgi:hypothetical protein